MSLLSSGNSGAILSTGQRCFVDVGRGCQLRAGRGRLALYVLPSVAVTLQHCGLRLLVLLLLGCLAC
jgi:hypothetical protein